MSARSNLSILQRNIIHGLDCEASAEVFLRACDKVSLLTAEARAYEHRGLLRFLGPALAQAARVNGLAGVPEGLRDFIAKRWWHWRIG